MSTVSHAFGALGERLFTLLPSRRSATRRAPSPAASRRAPARDAAPKPRRADRSPAAEPRPVICAACGHAAGYLVDLDGVAYRVLEDAADTELIADADPDTSVQCAHCGTPTTIAAALSSAQRDAPAVAPRTPRPHAPPLRLHDAAKETPHRTTKDGHVLPICPECGNKHNFLADIDGVAYHVLEDDNDTELIGEATNLLCTRCHAVFRP